MTKGLISFVSKYISVNNWQKNINHMTAKV
jgi:hypothetical protein